LVESAQDNAARAKATKFHRKSGGGLGILTRDDPSAVGAGAKPFYFVDPSASSTMPAAWDTLPAPRVMINEEPIAGVDAPALVRAIQTDANAVQAAKRVGGKQQPQSAKNRKKQSATATAPGRPLPRDFPRSTSCRSIQHGPLRMIMSFIIHSHIHYLDRLRLRGGSMW
jgi:hypothetical protein